MRKRPRPSPRLAGSSSAALSVGCSMTLAYRNLLHDRTRFAVTVVGIAFAVFLMIFQGSLLAGFLSAASEVVDATDAALWITARGVPCLDLPAPLPERFRALAEGVPGVAAVDRLATSFGTWQKPDGVRRTVIIVGADAGVGPRFPRPLANAAAAPDGGLRVIPARDGARDAQAAERPEAVLIAASELANLGVPVIPSDVEIGRHRARVAGALSGFGSFLGTPYVFTRYVDAVRYMEIGPEETRFLLVQLQPGADREVVLHALSDKLAETDVWTREEFAARARSYWLTQTGAGGTILTAGILGFVVGMVIVSQTIYATTMENIEEFATLKAMGASRGYIRRVVLMQAIASGLVGYATGLLATIPMLALMRGAIPWVQTPAVIPAGMLAVSLIMCAIASLVSVREAVRVEPARVFRG